MQIGEQVRWMGRFEAPRPALMPALWHAIKPDFIAGGAGSVSQGTDAGGPEALE